MKYELEIKPRALKDLSGIPNIEQIRMLEKLEIATTRSSSIGLKIGRSHTTNVISYRIF
jgi:hypothetical protein